MSEAVHVDQIKCLEECQPRAILNPDAVTEYADALKEDQELPPLDVVKVGDDLVLIDGFHRLAAHRQAGREFARVNIVASGDMGDALWHASAVNQRHGVRRTNADKRAAVTLALRSDIGIEQSLRTVAKHVGVSHTFVQNVQSELATSATEEPEPPEEPEDESPFEDDGRSEPDMYTSAARRIKGCYNKVRKILGPEDDVCEQLYRALEMASERES